jgi:putative NADPH-quinone reductase
MARITILQGHPSVERGRFCHALADAYAEGAAAAGHEVRRIEVAALDFPLLRGKEEWERGALPAGLAEAQAALGWAQHIVIVYPLWLGAMPALLKGFLEQTLRPGFAFDYVKGGAAWRKRLGGRSVRVVVTMGMPALAYRWWFGAHSLKSLERNILGFVGLGPRRHTLIGLVEAMGDARRRRWLDRLRDLGRRGR